MGVLVIVLMLSACAAQTSEKVQQTGQETAPVKSTAAFKLQGLNETEIDSSLVHQPMLLNFWATWCHFCKEEMPAIDQLSQEYEGRVAFAAINLTHLDSIRSVEEYIQKNQYTIPVYLDAEGKVTRSFQVLSTPTLIILDHQGNMAYKKVGAGGDTQTYRDMLDKLLTEMKTQGG